MFPVERGDILVILRTLIRTAVTPSYSPCEWHEHSIATSFACTRRGTRRREDGMTILGGRGECLTPLWIREANQT